MSRDFESNLRIVLDYFDVTFCQKDPNRAAMLYLHEDYIHHGRGSGSSRQEFIVYFSSFFRAAPKFKAEVLHSVIEDDMVVLRVVASDSESSSQKMVAEFYRLKDGKIKEHWHVVEN